MPRETRPDKRGGGDTPGPTSIVDMLLEPAEIDELTRDLAEMARLRRRAEDASANLPMP